MIGVTAIVVYVCQSLVRLLWGSSVTRGSHSHTLSPACTCEHSLECAAVGSCDDVPERIKTEELSDCCEGFTARPAVPYDEDYFDLYYTGVRKESLGCPVGETTGDIYIYDCVI